MTYIRINWRDIPVGKYMHAPNDNQDFLSEGHHISNYKELNELKYNLFLNDHIFITLTA